MEQPPGKRQVVMPVVVPSTFRINVRVVPKDPEELQIGNPESRDLVYGGSRYGGFGTGEAFNI